MESTQVKAFGEYQKIIEKFPVGVFVWHLDDLFNELSLRLVAANSRTERETNVPIDDMMNKQIGQVFPGMVNTQFPPLCKQVILNKKEHDFGVISYSDQRTPLTWFKIRVFPLPSKCVAMIVENVDKQEENSRKEFETVVNMLDSVIDTVMEDFYKKNEIGVLCHILCHLISFYAEQVNSSTGTIKTTDVMTMIDRLLVDGDSDVDYVHHFLITFRYFTQPQVVLHALILRFIIQSTYATNYAREVERVQTRIISIFQEWIECHFYDFLQNRRMLNTFRIFIEKVITNSKCTSVKEWKYPLLLLLEEQMHNQKINASPAYDSPSNHVPLIKQDFLRVSPLEIAHQLTTILSDRFYDVRPNEFFRAGWMSERKEFVSPNILSMIRLSNRISFWVISEIVSTFSLEKRVLLVKHFIEVAIECLSYNDFETAFNISLALQSSPVSRLTNTWKALELKYIKLWERLRHVTSHSKNYKNYRDLLGNILAAQKQQNRVPVLPYFALFLKDLAVTSEAKESSTKGWDKINFETLNLLGSPISQVMFFQQTKYSFERNIKLKSTLLFDLPMLDQDKQYENSKKCQKSARDIAADPIFSKSLDDLNSANSSSFQPFKLFSLRKPLNQKSRKSLDEEEPPSPVQQNIKLERKESDLTFSFSYENLLVKSVTSSMHNLNVQQIMEEKEDNPRLQPSHSEPIRRKKTKEEKDARKEAKRKAEQVREEELRKIEALKRDAEELREYTPYLDKVLAALDELITVSSPIFQKKLRIAVEERLDVIRRKQGNRASMP